MLADVDDKMQFSVLHYMLISLSRYPDLRQSVRMEKQNGLKGKT